MSLDICTLSALSALLLAGKGKTPDKLTALVVTDTNDRSSAWAFKFAENLGLKYVGWHWDRKFSVWDLVLEQVGIKGAKPMAQVHLYFAAGDFGYVLSMLEYQPLFWMGKALKFGPEVSRRQPVQEAVYAADNGREVATVVKKLSYACKDDLDPTDRLTRLLNEISRAYPFKFVSVHASSVEIETDSMDIYHTYLKPLEVFGYDTKIYTGSSAKHKLAIESPKLATGK